MSAFSSTTRDAMVDIGLGHQALERLDVDQCFPVRQFPRAERPRLAGHQLGVGLPQFASERKTEPEFRPVSQFFSAAFTAALLKPLSRDATAVTRSSAAADVSASA